MKNTIHGFGFVSNMVCYLNVSLEYAAEQYLTKECSDEELSVEECIEKYHRKTFEFKESFRAYDVYY